MLQPQSHNACEFLMMFIMNFFFAILLPVYLSSVWVIIKPNQAIIFSSFGKVRKVVKKPGCYYNPLLDGQLVSTKIETLQIKGSSVPDMTGSPMHVSAIVNYRISDPIRAVYAIDNYQEYI